MPVRFKGLSEYQRNFLWKKSYLSESRNPSVGQKYPWAGLRSDQLGISKEPNFISKRRVPYHDTQISKSLEWNGPISEHGVVVSAVPQAPEIPKSQEAEQKDVNQERVLSLEASRVPKRTRSHSVDSGAEGASDTVERNDDVVTNHGAVDENVELEPSTKPLSENIVHNRSNFVPQSRGNSIIHETEYKRNFKGLSPLKEPKLRDDLKENGNIETLSPEKKYNKTDDPLKFVANMASKDPNQAKKKPTPWRHQRLGKVNSEYRAKFLSPAQYLYKAGAWTPMKENMPSQVSVKELREKAQFYRKRVQGTHFSRDHLNQILSDNNYCWDVSSTTSSEGTISSNIRALDLAGDPTSQKTLQKHSPTKVEDKRVVLEEQLQKSTPGVSDAPTIPVSRRLAWDEENTNEDTHKQPTGEEEEEGEMEKDKQQPYLGELEKRDLCETSKADKIKEGSEFSSISSGKGGRLPTPKLRELGGIQRTHHDLTTPAVGGAVLVSPSKVKPSVPEQRKRMASHDDSEMVKNGFIKQGNCAMSLMTSPAAGMKTVDPLPLREETEASISRFTKAALPVSKTLECPTNSPGQPSQPCPLSYWHPSRRIQGCMRDPEFQHNEGKTRMNDLQLPQHDTFNDEDVDRLSEISVRSAASSLRAFQTLARAQRRRENFWGKT
uniref:Nuclear protein MDM1 n=1 Tax=Jaculus jaculus TaxID=51337 RepID=A0A8C5LBI8_JACJA